MLGRSHRVTAVLAFSFAMTVALVPCASAETVRAVEYYHVEFEQYFVTAKAAEIAALDSGAIKGWWRTGQRYRVDDAAAPGLSPVCRFYSPAFAERASHFYTVSAAECGQLKANPAWTYEGIAFFVEEPNALGACGTGFAPVHRLYNNGRGGAPNHAYTAFAPKRDVLVAAGWIAEGVAYCVPTSASESQSRTRQLTGGAWSVPIAWDFPVEPNATLLAGGEVRDGADGSDNNRVGRYPVYVRNYVVLGSENGAISGVGGWDPLADAYSMAFDSGFYLGGDAGTIAYFDGVDSESIPACAHEVWFNLLSATKVHPFQPLTVGRCFPGTVRRIKAPA
jgi:hypothetical protein